MMANELTLNPSFSAIVNLQYLTALYAEHNENWSVDWPSSFQMLMGWAVEYSKTEPESWEDTGTDWETDITAFFHKKVQGLT